MDLEKQKEHFKNHVAKFTDYGTIKILDFKNPKTSEYRIRFLFEEDYYRLHISGDLGELTATNYENMCFEKFGCYVNNPGYFEEKINCCERRLYFYDSELAAKQLIQEIEDLGIKDDILMKYDDLREWTDAMLIDFEEDTGMGNIGITEASDLIDDFNEDCELIGRKSTGIIDLYMMAFRLAQDKLNSVKRKNGSCL